MSRLRTGHKPSDWSEPDGGAYARLSGHSGGSIHGELVRSVHESDADKNRRYKREYDARKRAEVQA